MRGQFHYAMGQCGAHTRAHRHPNSCTCGDRCHFAVTGFERFILSVFFFCVPLTMFLTILWSFVSLPLRPPTCDADVAEASEPHYLELLSVSFSSAQVLFSHFLTFPARSVVTFERTGSLLLYSSPVRSTVYPIRGQLSVNQRNPTARASQPRTRNAP